MCAGLCFARHAGLPAGCCVSTPASMLMGSPVCRTPTDSTHLPNTACVASAMRLSWKEMNSRCPQRLTLTHSEAWRSSSGMTIARTGTSSGSSTGCSLPSSPSLNMSPSPRPWVMVEPAPRAAGSQLKIWTARGQAWARRQHPESRCDNSGTKKRQQTSTVLRQRCNATGNDLCKADAGCSTHLG